MSCPHPDTFCDECPEVVTCTIYKPKMRVCANCPLLAEVEQYRRAAAAFIRELGEVER